MPRLRTVLVYIATEKHVTRISRRHSFEWTVCKRKPWVNFTNFQSLLSSKIDENLPQKSVRPKTENIDERGPVNLSKSLHANRNKGRKISQVQGTSLGRNNRPRSTSTPTIFALNSGLNHVLKEYEFVDKLTVPRPSATVINL